ncbi:hypothetical protein HMPREF9016_01328 [Neisseria sp. oral taxon 014 str. F0314]|jgi:hypothetical protein|uniref:hypothetical protein n=1 Tax=Neisseria sp. oral taxon 014 TaxID=641148 RepID=UPI0001D8CD3D|nr:hypothetical protein [Neisseria sp. oral taxon 014]EFI22943.1 hypothetical protein HMPREF9016_01328 [Neisseria sp. oral taxon 014 str. F0314]
MSFAYLIAASRPCPMLAKMRGEAFALVAQDTDLWVYFRFCEGSVYTERSETESCMTEKGAEWLRWIYGLCGGSFVFSDVLLRHREGEEDFAKLVLKHIKENKVSVAQISAGLRLDLRCFYRMEM